jgi:hypothetical protein
MRQTIRERVDSAVDQALLTLSATAEFTRAQDRREESARSATAMLATGPAGTALLIQELGRRRNSLDEFRATQHQLLSSALDAAQKEKITSYGLLEGISGLAFVLVAVAEGTSRYKNALLTLDDAMRFIHARV